MFDYSPPPVWIEISGFKSLKDPARIELHPLTLLAGANNSGKSSFFQPLLLLKQSLEAFYETDPLLLDGSHIAFTSLKQIFSFDDTKDIQDQSFTITVKHFISKNFERVKNGDEEHIIYTYDIRFVFSFKKIKQNELENENELELKLQTFIKDSNDDQWIELIEDHRKYQHLLKRNTNSKMLFFEQNSLQTNIVASVIKKDSSSGKNLISREYLGSKVFYNWIRSIFHLPGFRGNQVRQHSMAKVTKKGSNLSAIGPLHRYTASLLHKWQKQVKDETARAKNASRKLEYVNKGLKYLGLTQRVIVKKTNDVSLELYVERISNAQNQVEDLVHLADVGFGVSQVLPVLVALAGAERGQMVLIEQPELHLHPKAQLAMGSLLADAAKRGIIVVVETHSQLILRAIQTKIAQKQLSSEKVGLHWFSRDPKTGWSSVTKAELLPDGSFGDWPVDFTDVFATADLDYINAVFGDLDEACH